MASFPNSRVSAPWWVRSISSTCSTICCAVQFIISYTPFHAHEYFTSYSKTTIFILLLSLSSHCRILSLSSVDRFFRSLAPFRIGNGQKRCELPEFAQKHGIQKRCGSGWYSEANTNTGRTTLTENPMVHPQAIPTPQSVSCLCFLYFVLWSTG